MTGCLVSKEEDNRGVVLDKYKNHVIMSGWSWRLYQAPITRKRKAIGKIGQLTAGHVHGTISNRDDKQQQKAFCLCECRMRKDEHKIVGQAKPQLTSQGLLSANCPGCIRVPNVCCLADQLLSDGFPMPSSWARPEEVW